MAVSVRMEAFDRDTLVSLAEGLAPAERSALLAQEARAAIAEAQAQNDRALGRDVARDVIVDGSLGKPVETVRPDGVIVASWDLGSDVVTWIVEQVVKHAPVLTGAFRDSIRIYADNVEVSGAAAAELSAGREVIVTSDVPYARKIERGQSRQAPEGVFEAVAAMARRRYGNQAQIKFTYRAPIGSGSALDIWAGKKTAGFSGRKRRAQMQKAMRQPAILIVGR